MRSRVRKDAGATPLRSWPELIAETLPRGARVVSPFASDDWREATMKAASLGDVAVLDAPPDVRLSDILDNLPPDLEALVGFDKAEYDADRLHAAGLTVFAVDGQPSGSMYAANYPLASHVRVAKEDEGDAERIAEAFSKYHATVNMSARELEDWAGTDCSKKASLTRAPISRNLGLLRKAKGDWTIADARAAMRTVSFVARMRGAEQGEPVSDGCPSARDISLKNWAFNPGKSSTDKAQGDLAITSGTPGYKQPEQGGYVKPGRKGDGFPWEKLTGSIKVVKAEAAEERLIFGIVLEPDTLDAQGDIVSANEIRQAAHKYMEDFGNIGLQHQVFVNGKLKVLESYIAPVAFDVGDEHVKAGSWLMAMRVLDDDIWQSVKDGLITGYSIGGSAVRRTQPSPEKSN